MVEGASERIGPPSFFLPCFLSLSRYYHDCGCAEELDARGALVGGEDEKSGTFFPSSRREEGEGGAREKKTVRARPTLVAPTLQNTFFQCRRPRR